MQRQRQDAGSAGTAPIATPPAEGTFVHSDATTAWAALAPAPTMPPQTHHMGVAATVCQRLEAELRAVLAHRARLDTTAAQLAAELGRWRAAALEHEEALAVPPDSLGGDLSEEEHAQPPHDVWADVSAHTHQPQSAANTAGEVAVTPPAADEDAADGAGGPEPRAT